MIAEIVQQRLRSNEDNRRRGRLYYTTIFDFDNTTIVYLSTISVQHQRSNVLTYSSIGKTYGTRSCILYMASSCYIGSYIYKRNRKTSLRFLFVSSTHIYRPPFTRFYMCRRKSIRFYGLAKKIRRGEKMHIVLGVGK